MERLRLPDPRGERRSVFRWPGLTLAIALLWVTGAAADVPPAPALDATLSDTTDQNVQLSAFRGKPALLIYEDRRSRELNRKLKDELWKRGQDQDLAGSLTVVGVANLQAYDFWPVRKFARSAVQDIEKSVGIKVLIDWKGSLAAKPWSLPARSSSVVLLDADGAVRYTHSGAMNDEQLGKFFDQLAAVIAVGSQQASR